MRRAFISILALIGAVGNIQAQNQQEWLQQDKTQKKYLVEQIAALKIFEQSLKVGYQVSTTGLSLIQRIKQGDWDLHHEFFDAKSKINPSIAKSKRVNEIIALELTILIGVKKLNGQTKNNIQLAKDEAEQVKRICLKLTLELAENMDQLIMILTDDAIKMNDDDREKRIDRLYEAVVDEHAFLVAFANSVGLLSAQRAAESRQIQFLNRVNKN